MQCVLCNLSVLYAIVFVAFGSLLSEEFHGVAEEPQQ